MPATILCEPVSWRGLGNQDRCSLLRLGGEKDNDECECLDWYDKIVQSKRPYFLNPELAPPLETGDYEP